MVIRTISGIIGLPILAVFVIIGGIPLKIGILALSLIGLYEFYKAVSKKIMPVHLASFLATVCYTMFLDCEFNEYYRMGTMILCAAVFLFIVFMYGKIGIFDISVSFIGFFYITFMLGNVFLLREAVDGIYTVWFIFICAFCSDTGAYFVGSVFGKHKITPVLSPKKTLEGALGGIIFTGLVAGFYGYCMYEIWNVGKENMTIFYGIVGVVGSVAAQIGDLAASSIKRQVEIKDFGKIMPGHGGVLDRFDSVLFTSPLIYILITLGREVFF